MDNLVYAIKFSEVKTDSGKFVRPNFYPDSYWPDTPEALELKQHALNFLKAGGVIAFYTRITGNLLETYQAYATKELAFASTTLKTQVCKFINVLDAKLEFQDFTTDPDYIKFLEYSKYRFMLNNNTFGPYKQINSTDVHELTPEDLEGFTKYDA